MRWKLSMEATTLSWVSWTPLGVPVVPLVKMSWKISSALGLPHAAWRASQSGGNAGSYGAGSAHRSSTLVVGKCYSPASRGSGASRPVPRMRCRAPLARATVSTASALMRRSSGTMTRRACIAPK